MNNNNKKINISVNYIVGTFSAFPYMMLLWTYTIISSVMKLTLFVHHRLQVLVTLYHITDFSHGLKKNFPAKNK